MFTKLESKFFLEIFESWAMVGSALVFTDDIFHERSIFSQSWQYVGGQMKAVKGRFGVFFQKTQGPIISA